jgi:hypothetical protein
VTLGFKHRASLLLSRPSTTWVTLPVPDLVIFQRRFCVYAQPGLDHGPIYASCIAGIARIWHYDHRLVEMGSHKSFVQTGLQPQSTSWIVRIICESLLLALGCQYLINEHMIGSLNYDHLLFPFQSLNSSSLQLMNTSWAPFSPLGKDAYLLFVWLSSFLDKFSNIFSILSLFLCPPF